MDLGIALPDMVMRVMFIAAAVQACPVSVPQQFMLWDGWRFDKGLFVPHPGRFVHAASSCRAA